MEVTGVRDRKNIQCSWGEAGAPLWGVLEKLDTTPATAKAEIAYLKRVMGYEVHHSWNSKPDIHCITMATRIFLVEGKKYPFKWQVVRIVTIALEKNRKKEMIP